MKKKITAVVVTYNRLNLLKKCISALKKQTFPLDNIIVINNDSQDGTTEWLYTQGDLDVIHQANVGGSGGFAKGLEYAFSKGFDWIWAMDDDVNPSNTCLENLLKYTKDDIGILVPLRIQDGKYYLEETCKLNFSNFFSPLKEKELTESDIQDKLKIPIEGMTFEGPLINCNLIKKIGLPNKDYFILYDDTDYSYRSVINGFPVFLIPEAIMNKELIINASFGQSKNNRSQIWKTYYLIRNNTYFNVKYGENILVRYVRPIFVTIKYSKHFFKNILFNNKYKWIDIYFFWHALFLGYRKNLNKI